MKTPGSIMLLTFFLIMYSLTSFADLLKGFDALKRKDYHQSLIYFKPLAEKGDAIAQMNLGIMYEHGQGVDKDEKRAVEFFTLAADQGHVKSQFYLAQMYRTGDGVRKNPVLAFKYYSLAARAGYLDAQYDLGLSYSYGVGTKVDFEKAYFWSNVSNLGGFKKSQKIIKLIDNYLDEKQKIEINNDIKTFLEKLSMKKNKLAIIQIAKWHLELSEEIDYINAYKWYNVAVAIGIKSAAKRRDEIIDELSAEEIFDAQKKSNNIFKKINKLGG